MFLQSRVVELFFFY